MNGILANCRARPGVVLRFCTPWSATAHALRPGTQPAFRLEVVVIILCLPGGDDLPGDASSRSNPLPLPLLPLVLAAQPLEVVLFGLRRAAQYASSISSRRRSASSDESSSRIWPRHQVHPIGVLQRLVGMLLDDQRPVRVRPPPSGPRGAGRRPSAPARGTARRRAGSRGCGSTPGRGPTSVAPHPRASRPSRRAAVRAPGTARGALDRTTVLRLSRADSFVNTSRSSVTRPMPPQRTRWSMGVNVGTLLNRTMPSTGVNSPAMVRVSSTCRLRSGRAGRPLHRAGP